MEKVMTTTIDKSVATSARQMDWKQEGSAVLTSDETDLGASRDTFAGQGASALALDQGLPRLLYELAVRLPVQPDIQALCVWLYEPVGHAIRLHVLMADLPATLGAGLGFPAADSIAGWVWKRQQPLTINTEAETRFPEFARALLETGIRSFCGVPLMIGNRRIGVLGLASTKPDAFRHFKLQFMQRGAQKAASVADNNDFQRPTNHHREREEKPMYLEEQVRPEDKFDDIIGRSASLRAVLDQIQIVAPTDSTVLVLGETGTGKELIARAIHNRSSRRDSIGIAGERAVRP